MVLVDVRWVELGLVSASIVQTVMTVSVWVNVVVRAVLLSAEVALVADVRLVVGQIPVALLEVSSSVVVLANDWRGLVWVLVRVHLIWGEIVVWQVPRSMV